MWREASRSVRMVTAALIWTVIGLGLLIAGSLLAEIPATLAGLVLGFLKGRYLLAGMARGNAARIVSGPAQASILASFPLSSWGVAGFMMALGLVLRHSGLSPRLLGFLYVVAGFGLLVASLSGWRAWRRSGARVTEP